MENSSFINHRFLLIALILSFSQLISIELAQAQELAQTATPVDDQNRLMKTQTSTTKSISSDVAKESSTLSENEVGCLALNIYFEARSEPEMGQRAVGHVVMNRVAHPSYPSSVCDVVHQGGEQQLHRCQFSWWCDGQSDEPINRKAWAKALELAQQIYSGVLKDTTDGALWYHATYATPYWSKILRQGDKIGQHIFYLENRRSKIAL